MMNRGFSLIELMIVILLIGIIATIGIPRFLRTTRTEAEQFIARLNALVADGAQLAVQTQQPQKVLFNLLARTVELQDVSDNKAKRSIDIPKVLEIEDVYINGKSQFTGEGEKRTVYFLITSEGISQEVRLVLTTETQAGKKTYELYLNPFTGIFRLA